jgi:hypothetical protein
VQYRFVIDMASLTEPADPTGGFQLFNQAPVQGQMVEDAFYYDASTGGLSINTGQDGMEDFFITIRLGSGAFLARMNSDNFLI